MCSNRRRRGRTVIEPQQSDGGSSCWTSGDIQSAEAPSRKAKALSHILFLYITSRPKPQSFIAARYRVSKINRALGMTEGKSCEKRQLKEKLVTYYEQLFEASVVLEQAVHSNQWPRIVLETGWRSNQETAILGGILPPQGEYDFCAQLFSWHPHANNSYLESHSLRDRGYVGFILLFVFWQANVEYLSQHVTSLSREALIGIKVGRLCNEWRHDTAHI